MAAKSHGRGAVRAIGLLVLIAGVVGAVVLFVLAEREPDRVADSFARAAPGCRTTLSFAESGDFYVFEEDSGMVVAVGCEPSVEDDQPFEWSIVDSNGSPVAEVEDRTVTYDLDVGSATSVARITIDRPGDYEVEVRGSDLAVIAAIGGDPHENVGRLRLAGAAAGVIGIVVGAVLLWLSRRRAGDPEPGADRPPPNWPPRPPSLDGLSLSPSAPASPWAPPSPGGQLPPPTATGGD